MKKILLTLITIIAINAATSAQIRFGVKGGINLANVSKIEQGVSYVTSSNLAFHVGIVLDSPLSENFSIQPALLFSQKGFIFNDSRDIYELTSNYIEVPVNFLYHVTDALTVGAGPYLGYALSASGKETSRGKSQTIDFDLAKRIDYGINITAGYEVIAGLVISANYSLGLANFGINAPSTSIKNNVIGFSLTKFFGER